MVGIVIVSHSAKLATGVKELVQQMIQTDVRVAIAAGIDDPENPFGTDALQIQAAIESVSNPAGVVVLMDLGSAILSAEMALEFLPQEQRKNVRLCEAPLVEGAIAAVVEAASGASIERVIASALSSLTAKISQLKSDSISLEEEKSQTNKTASDTPSQQIQLTVLNPHGLHARPAAKLVTTASAFQADIKLQNLTAKSQIVSAKSINQVMLLGVCQGHQIAVSSTGEDAAEAISALQELIERGFGESTHTPLTVPSLPTSPSSLTGIPAAPGIAIAPAFIYQPTILEVVAETTDNPSTEWHKLQQAIALAIKELERLVTEESEESASIFSAHLLYLKDPELINNTRQIIFDRSLSAATAWKMAIAQLTESYQALDDPYLQARIADIEDVGLRILRLLLGESYQSIDIPQGVILVAGDLTVSEMAQLKSGRVLGICTVVGSATAHSALIANQLGIPMVVGLGRDLFAIAPNTEIAIDGATGQIWLEPGEEQRQQLQAQSNLLQQQAIPSAAITLDGQTIPVLANIMGLNNAAYALKCGADGVGLLRTELLYLDRSTGPTEAEQLKTIEEIGAIMGDRPLTIRTLDIGADKPVPYLDLPVETNPALGWRGIRQSLDCPDLLKTQLRAILRASGQHKIKLMFPMVTSVTQVRAAKKLVLEVQAELRENKIDFDSEMAIGIMIETPAAVAMADLLAREVDFFSIGTNDLGQYIMAADRTNPKVAALVDACEPAVLRAIHQTVDAARNEGITVSVCGQLASDPTAVPILLGLGIDELSVNPPAIPAIKAYIANLSRAETEALATAALQLDSAVAVREYLSSIALEN